MGIRQSRHYEMIFRIIDLSKSLFRDLSRIDFFYQASFDDDIGMFL